MVHLSERLSRTGRVSKKDDAWALIVVLIGELCIVGPPLGETFRTREGKNNKHQ